MRIIFTCLHTHFTTFTMKTACLPFELGLFSYFHDLIMTIIQIRCTWKARIGQLHVGSLEKQWIGYRWVNQRTLIHHLNTIHTITHLHFGFIINIIVFTFDLVRRRDDLKTLAQSCGINRWPGGGLPAPVVGSWPSRFLWGRRIRVLFGAASVRWVGLLERWGFALFHFDGCSLGNAVDVETPPLYLVLQLHDLFINFYFF